MTGHTMHFSTIIVLALILVLSMPAVVIAQDTPPVTGERYLVVLNPPKNNVPELTDNDITAVGGRVEYKVSGRVDVTLPADAVAALRKQGRVKYIQKASLGPPPVPAASILRLKPSAASLHPTTEATPPTWRSGTYLYDTSGNIYAIGIAGDTGSPVQHRYAYDEVSRLNVTIRSLCHRLPRPSTTTPTGT